MYLYSQHISQISFKSNFTYYSINELIFVYNFLLQKLDI